MKGIVKERGDEPTECELAAEEHLKPCWPLGEQLGSSFDSGSRLQGLKLVTLVDVETHKFSREVIIAKGNGKRSSLNFCPFCATPLQRAVVELIEEKDA